MRVKSFQNNFKLVACLLCLILLAVPVVGCKSKPHAQTATTTVGHTQAVSTQRVEGAQANSDAESTDGKPEVTTETTADQGLLDRLKHLIKPEDEQKKKQKPARYGTWGEQIATQFATEFPNRYAGSESEGQAAEFIAKSLSELGYEVERQEFEYGDESHSANLIVTIPGTGFRKQEPGLLEQNKQLPELEANLNDKFVVIGAHYDTPQASAIEDVDYKPDGIHNNAAGVAALLTFAKQAREVKPGYTVKLVFFGASSSDYAGANAYLDSLSEEQRSLLDAMYNVDRIYAGDKVYLHAGWNALREDGSKDYDKRRKLYQMTDVYYQNLLLTNNNFEVYTNQSLEGVDFFDDGGSVLYREWTKHSGDHTPFDKAGFPIVFCESYEYNVKVAEQTKETLDPQFSAVDGYVSGSGMDSSSFLNAYFAAKAVEQKELFKEDKDEDKDKEDDQNRLIDRLENRINNVAFLLLESTRRGPEGSEQID